MEVYRDAYTEEGFIRKSVHAAKRIGAEILFKLFTLYYVLKRADVPVWVKSYIVLALGYFISPIDGIPDPLPGGFVDDIAVIALVIRSVSGYINDVVISAASNSVKNMTGLDIDTSFKN